jgi:hypothetical protein
MQTGLVDTAFIYVWRAAADLALFEEVLMAVVMQAVVNAGVNPEFL